MTPITFTQPQSSFYPVLPPLDTAVETRAIANPVGSAFSPLPEDIRTKLCEMLFLEGTECLSSFFRTCGAINTIWKRAFLEQHTESIARYVESLSTLKERRIAVARICGGGALLQPIIDLLGMLVLDCSLQDPESKWLVDYSPPRLLCKRLVIYNRAHVNMCRGGDSWIDRTSPCLALMCRQVSTLFRGDPQRCYQYQDMSSICPPFLESLEISAVYLTDALLAAFVKKCPRLTRLKLSNCPNVSFSGMPVWESVVSLESLGCHCLLGNAGLRNIARCCPQLASLRIRCPLDPIQSRIGKVITSEGLMALAEGCPQLTTLKLHPCENIDGASLWALAEQCPSLRHIELEGEVLPTLRDCVLLLRTFTSVTNLVIVRQDDLVSASTHTPIVEYLGRSGPQQIVDLAWACAVLGLNDRCFIDALIKRAMGTHLNDEKIAKMNWVCGKFNSVVKFLTQGPSGPPSGEEPSFHEQDGPEERQAAREKAAKVLMAFL